MIPELNLQLENALTEMFPSAELNVVQCLPEGIDDVMSFIDKQWKAGHIMSKDRELVDFMHRNGNVYNISVGKSAGRVCGILGYIPTSQYDLELQQEADIWLAIWKNIGAPGSGLKLLLPIVRRANTIGAIGINSHVAKVYKWLGFSVCKLRQLYLLNDSMDKFEIACCENLVRDATERSGVRFEELSLPDLGKLDLNSSWRPRKSSCFIINRYLKHPIYRYRVLQPVLESGEHSSCVFVVRKISVGRASCLRLVDIVGDLELIPPLKMAWLEYLREHNLEYVDCMQYGLKEQEEKLLGLDVLDIDGDVVIPNYFEPFERRNIIITAAFKNPSKDRYVMFKGDSDQDRPSVRI